LPEVQIEVDTETKYMYN